MKLILMRHGQAGYQSTNDADRQLTEFGQKQAQQSAQALLERYQPDLFVVSPYTRAKQTLAAFTKINPEIPVVELEGITPDADPVKGLDSIFDLVLDAAKQNGVSEQDKLECVLVVCHMPIVAKMAGLLIAQDAEPYALAEARVFDAELVAPDMGDEVDRFVPDQY
ncbi:SixA phosphatase family protein [Psychrobacter sp. FDAARGOS_221]|uniref:SixA phosphatase family protein n=1 Tax=Psychrobacter sp. FDAARGOS_221 TaxID=1975705 RepID=UPI000BB599B2|nr:histidine phosphatase family protein [Psychrobacter sp. FDAARGOS_221]PNK61694.1 phosphohistidine phosphatase SixA [Psychrobacter sp. FDAARGOS_221]